MNKAKPRGIAYGLRRARLERHMTLETAARKLGWSPSHLSRVERGQRGADPAAVSAALGIPASDLLRTCPRCLPQRPAPGYQCTECGTITPAPAPASTEHAALTAIFTATGRNDA